MRSLKIAFLSRWYAEEDRRSGSAEGGPTRQLAEAVAALGHEVVVLSQSADVGALKQAQIGKLEVWLSPRDRKRDFLTGLRDKWAKRTYGHRKIYSDAAALREFMERRGRFDVLWAHCEEPDGLVAAIAAREGALLPPVLTQIFALRYRFESGLPRFTEQAALRTAFRHATRIIANSELVAASLSHYADARLTEAQLQAKVRVVHHNLQADFLRAAEENTPALPVEPQRVLFLGALNEKKGALIFLEAARRSEMAKEGATFAVIGDFTEKNPRFVRRWNEELAAVRAQLPPAQLELLGKVSPAEVIRQARLAKVVVLPSLFDEFSRALVEMLILGRPVITTNQVGAWPLVRDYDCGLVVEANDPDSLAHAIDLAVSPDAPYAGNAQYVAHRLIHEFSSESIARRIAKHLVEIASA